MIFGCEQTQNSKSKKNADLHKPMSWGHKQTIYVFADDSVWKYAEKPLRESLERFHFTTENEKYFKLKRVENIEQYYKFNNLLFFCDMQSEADISKYVKNLLGAQVEHDIKDNLVGMFPQNNLWANDQKVLFLIGENERNLLILNIEMPHKIFQIFKDKLFERISTQIYKTDVYSMKMFDSVPWKLKLPKNYVVYKKDSKNNFVSFIARLRNHADRYISVYYEKMDEEKFDSNWLKDKRANLAWKYYDEDEFSEKDIKLQKYKIGEQKGWKLSGRWQNKKYAVGGAFQSFAIYDKKSKTAFLIDNSIYFPEGYKLPALIELEIISNTFEVE